MNPSTPHPDAHGGRHFQGFRIREIVHRRVIGGEGADYLRGFQRRLVDLVVAMTNRADDRLTHELRFVARPRAAGGNEGIEAACLLRVDDPDAAAAGRIAAAWGDLLAATFDELRFEPLDGAALAALRAPFPVAAAAAIVRRAEWERLDSIGGTPRRRARLGFLADAPPDPAHGDGEAFVHHVYPFVHTHTDWRMLFELLLRHAHPVAVGIRLRPARLEPDELRHLEASVVRCERAAQAGLGGGDPAHLRPALHAHAREHQQHLSRRLFGLKDNAALVTIEAVSTAPLPDPLLDALGSHLTRPAGVGWDAAPERADYLAGGYEIVHATDPTSVARSWRDLEPEPLAPDGPGSAPPRLRHLFDAVEASAVFRLPPSALLPVPGIGDRAWRARPLGEAPPSDGCALGIEVDREPPRIARIAAADRDRHVYVVGQTGTGKSTLLRAMALHDIAEGHGVCVVDPHGDLVRDLLERIPAARADDVVLLDPTDRERPIGLNLLQHDGEDERHYIAQEMVGIILRIMEDDYGDQAHAMMGPMFLQHVRMNLLLVMSDPERPGTLLDFYWMFQEKDYWRHWLPLKARDPLLRRWVEQVLPKQEYTRVGQDGVSFGGYVSSKFESFAFDPLLRGIFGQRASTLDLRAVMDEGKILLVNLAKGALTEPTARFLGMVFMAKLGATTLARGRTPDAPRRRFHLYVDEFHNLATGNFTSLLSEARKFGLSMVLANQFLTQLEGRRILDAVFGNVGTIVSFRVGQRDAEILEREFAPAVSAHDLTHVSNWVAYVRSLRDGRRLEPFSIRTMLPAEPADPVRAADVRARSRARHGRRVPAAELAPLPPPATPSGAGRPPAPPR